MSRQVKIASVVYPLIDSKYLDRNSGIIQIKETALIEILNHVRGKKVYQEIINYLKRGLDFVGYDVNYTTVNHNQPVKMDVNQVHLTACYFKKSIKSIKVLTKKKQYHSRKTTTWGLIKKEATSYGI
jgi:hypothetical protein